MTETVLFVGGSSDGKPATLFGKPIVYCGDMEGFGEIKLGTYPAMYKATNKNTGEVIIIEDPDNLIPLLIEGYRMAKT
jgi:hypothetical protein